MTKRLSSEAVNIEYVDTSNYLRLASEVIMIEYKGAANYLRLLSVGIMVEYAENAAPTRTQGPAAQMMC